MGDQPGKFNPGGFDFVRELQTLKARVARNEAANPFATMGIAPKEGGIDVQGFINSLRGDSTLSLSMDDDGAFVVFDAAENPVARFGELIESNPGNYGVEILFSGSWVQVGSGNVDWINISNKPATFAPSAHTHAGGDVTSAVAESTITDGNTTAAFNRDIAGIPGTFKAVWMHSTNVFGFNTSDERYKRNIRDYSLSPEQFLALRAVIYDRKATNADDYTPAVRGDELGLIAGEVEPNIPELALRYDGKLDGVFYERLPVAMLPIVQAHVRTIAALEAENTQQAADIAALQQAVRDLGGNV